MSYNLQKSIPAALIRGKDWRTLDPATLLQQTQKNTAGGAPLAAKKVPALQSEQRQGKTVAFPGAEVQDDNVSKMNKLEHRFSLYLEAERQAGRIVRWKYEAIKLKLAPKTTYTPDFFVELPGKKLIFYETKGFFRDDAKVKVKVAAAMFPCFKFCVVMWDKKTGWSYTWIPSGD